MAIKKITYSNKVGVIPKNIHVNEVWDDDMNEIKDAINTNADQTTQNTNDITNILSGAVVPDATALVKGKIQLAGDLGGTASAPTVPGLLLRAMDTDVVHKAGTESITGNKTFTGTITVQTPTAANHAVTKAYADGLVVGLLDDRGSYNASTNLFPSTGGSGTSGAILKGDLWYVSVAGTLGGKTVAIGDSFRALIDSPAQVASNWSILSSNLGYIPANDANVVHKTGNETVGGQKTFSNTSFMDNGMHMKIGGFLPATVGYNGFNATSDGFSFSKGNDGFISRFAFGNTAIRDIAFPNKSGTVAFTSDLNAGTVTGTGTTNFLSKWTSSSAQGDSRIIDTGTRISFGNIGGYGDYSFNKTAFGNNEIVLSTTDGTQNPRAFIRHVTTSGSQSVDFTSLYSTASALANWNFITGNVGIGSNNPIGKLDIFTGTTGLLGNLATMPFGTISFGNGASSTALPTIYSKTDNSIGLRIIAGTNDTNPIPDMALDVRRNDNNDFTILSTPAFRFSRNTSTLLDILRNGNTIFTNSSTDTYASSSGSLATVPTQYLFANSSATDGAFSMMRFSTSRVGGQSAITYLGTVNTSVNNESIFVIGRRTGATSYEESMRISANGSIGIGTGSNITGKFQVIDTNGGFFFDGTHANYNRFKSTSTTAGVSRDLLFSTQTSGTTPDLYIDTSGKIGIGTITPIGKLDVNTGTTGLSFNMLNQNIGSITLSNGTSLSEAPTLAGKSNSNQYGIRFVAGTIDTNTSTDMLFQAMENDQTDYSAPNLGSSAFRFARFSTTLIDILRNGNTSFIGNISAPLFTGNASLTGTPTAPTATAGTNTTQIATTAFVQAAITAAASTSGTYTPTISNITNTSSLSILSATYIKVGNIVTVNVGFQFTATATAGCTVRITFPVNRATTNTLNIGSGSGQASLSGILYPIVLQSTTNSNVDCYIAGTATNPTICNVTFQYSILS